MMTRKLTALLLASLLVLAACGDDTQDAADGADDDTAADDAADAGDGDDGDGAGDGNGDVACTLDGPVPIGVVYSLTGGAGVYGASQLAAAELAAEDVNEEGDIELELVVEDDASDPSQGITAYERLIESEDVSA